MEESNKNCSQLNFQTLEFNGRSYRIPPKISDAYYKEPENEGIKEKEAVSLAEKIGKNLENLD